VKVTQESVETAKHALDLANEAIWNSPTQLPWLVALLLGTGIFLTLRLGFINLRGFRHAIRVVAGVYDDPNDPGDITHFQALTTALSATVGIGNIAGVATAIHYGGPGALFWMWLTALFGMTTKFTECTLALHFRKDNADGSVSGGPMYYIEKGLGRHFKPLAVFFAVCAVVSSCGSGNSVQAFTMADQFRADFGIPTWISGGVSAALVALVILGGIKRIGSVASKLMPAMAILYFIGALAVLVIGYRDVPAAMATILADAFRPTAAIAGFAGATFVYGMRWGVKRGLFSNEAGQGSAPIAHAAARTDEPVREGAVALLEPFVDTLIVCTLTGLMIVTTGVWKEKKEGTYPVTTQSDITVVSQACRLLKNTERGKQCPIPPGRIAVKAGVPQGVRLIINHGFVDGPRIAVKDKLLDGFLLVDGDGKPRVLDQQGKKVKGAKLTGYTLLNSSPLTAWALQLGLQKLFPYGHLIVTFCVFLFAISTAIGWSYYGDRCAQYLLGDWVVLPYKGVFVLMHFVGAVVRLEVVWAFADVALGLMSVPNLLAILILSGTVARLSRDYFGREHVPFKR